jgi:hypothetical protein
MSRVSIVVEVTVVRNRIAAIREEMKMMCYISYRKISEGIIIMGLIS